MSNGLFAVSLATAAALLALLIRSTQTVLGSSWS